MNIKELRKEKGLSQKELAELTGLSVWWINHVENGKRNPSYVTLAKIAKALDVPLDALF